MNRREFFTNASVTIMKWCPWLGLFGFQFHRYTYGPVAGYSGWITWFGRLVAFVEK